MEDCLPDQRFLLAAQPVVVCQHLGLPGAVEEIDSGRVGRSGDSYLILGAAKTNRVPLSLPILHHNVHLVQGHREGPADQREQLPCCDQDGGEISG